MHPGLPVGRGQTGADSNGGEFEDSRGYQSSPEVDTVQPLTYSESNDTDDDLLDHTEMTKSLSFDSGVQRILPSYTVMNLQSSKDSKREVTSAGDISQTERHVDREGMK